MNITVYTFGTIDLKTHKQGVIAITHKPEEGFNIIQSCTPAHFDGVFTVEKKEVEINRYINSNMPNLTKRDINDLNLQYGLNYEWEPW